MNFEKARSAMVHRQIRAWDVSDRRVLDALLALPREAFVPSEYRELAYADTGIPLADGQEMLPPRVVARILQALNPGPGDHVLEIGAGSGYLTALLAMLAREVVSVEISPSLQQQARAVLAGQNVGNAQVLLGDAFGGWGDAASGWARAAPFDVIVLTGSVSVLPADLPGQLKENGRLLAVVGEGSVMAAHLITRNLREKIVFETTLPPLKQPAPRTDGFVL